MSVRSPQPSLCGWTGASGVAVVDPMRLRGRTAAILGRTSTMAKARSFGSTALAVFWLLISATSPGDARVMLAGSPRGHIIGGLSNAHHRAPAGSGHSRRAVDRAEDAVVPTRSTRDSCLYCQCEKVYLDVGTNIGIQIRKLYQPELFPKAAVLPLFESEFGAGNRSDVCAFGFEPNPRHTQELLNIQDAYRKLGYPVHIFTGTAVSDTNGQATFFLDDNPKRRDWGASLINHQWTRGKTRAVVNTTDFASFVLDNFSSEAKIVMKLDVEGAEFKILPNLVLSGALCRMSKVVIEWHDRLFRSGWMINKKLRLHSQHIAGMLRHMGATSKLCPVKFVSMDDESYGNMDTKKLSLPEVSVPEGVKRRR